MDFEKEVDEKVEEVKDDEYWKNNYISIQMWKWDAIREGEERGKTVGMAAGIAEGKAKGIVEGRAEGLAEGREEQKAEDEKIIAQKDARIAELEALLKKVNSD